MRISTFTPARAGVPPQNFHCADRTGRVGWTVAGRLPRRVGFDGRLPGSFADGVRRWQGLAPPEETPRLADPPSGRLWTANARVADGPALARIGDGGYALGARAGQIQERLFAREAFSEQDLLAIQLDDRALFLAHQQRLPARRRGRRAAAPPSWPRRAGAGGPAAPPSGARRSPPPAAGRRARGGARSADFDSMAAAGGADMGKAPPRALRCGRLTTSGTCTSMSRLASAPRLPADSPFMVVPLADTSESRSAVSGARSPPALKKSRWPHEAWPLTVSRALSTMVSEVPWRVTSSVSTAGCPWVDW